MQYKLEVYCSTFYASGTGWGYLNIAQLCPFWDFPNLSGISRFSGIFPIGPCPLSRRINSTYEEESRKGPQHNHTFPEKKGGKPPGWESPGLASLNPHHTQGTFPPPDPLFQNLTTTLSSTIRSSWITLHHFIFGVLISVIFTLPITPNNFWGFNKRNSQEKLHALVLSLLGRITPPITPKYSQRINWRNLGYTRTFLGN